MSESDISDDDLPDLVDIGDTDYFGHTHEEVDEYFGSLIELHSNLYLGNRISQAFSNIEGACKIRQKEN
jgi:hypothetical protein